MAARPIEETAKIETFQLISQFRAHLAAHFFEYSPLLISLLLWFLALSPGTKQRAVRSDGSRMEPVSVEHAGG